MLQSVAAGSHGMMRRASQNLMQELMPANSYLANEQLVQVAWRLSFFSSLPSVQVCPLVHRWNVIELGAKSDTVPRALPISMGWAFVHRLVGDGALLALTRSTTAWMQESGRLSS